MWSRWVFLLRRKMCNLSWWYKFLSNQNECSRYVLEMSCDKSFVSGRKQYWPTSIILEIKQYFKQFYIVLLSLSLFRNDTTWLQSNRKLWTRILRHSLCWLLKRLLKSQWIWMCPMPSTILEHTKTSTFMLCNHICDHVHCKIDYLRR